MKKKKLIKVLAIALVLVLGLSAVAFGASVTKSINVMMGGIKLYVDDEQFTPKDANGNVVQPIVYNGTTYLPARAVSEALGKAVHWDNATKSVYIGDHDSSVPDTLLKDLAVFSAQFLLKDGKPPTSMKVPDYDKVAKGGDGKTYADGYHFFGYNPYWAAGYTHSFLLEGKYSEFKGSFILDEEAKSQSLPFTLSILGDGEVLYEANNLTGGFAPKTFEVNVTGVQVLTLQAKLDNEKTFPISGPYAGTVFRTAELYK